jgi:hypothetical protein
MSHHEANLEPLNIYEFLLIVLFVSKAADPCVSSGWPSVLVQFSLLARVNNSFFICSVCIQPVLRRSVYHGIFTGFFSMLCY